MNMDFNYFFNFSFGLLHHFVINRTHPAALLNATCVPAIFTFVFAFTLFDFHVGGEEGVGVLKWSFAGL